MKSAVSLAQHSVQEIIRLQCLALGTLSAAHQRYKPLSPTKQQTVIVEEMGLEDCIIMYSARSVNRLERGRNEGVLRSRLARAVDTHEVLGALQPLLKSMLLDHIFHKAFRSVAAGSQRADGRSPLDLRPISCAANVLPSVHGSSYFCRGETHVLCTTTLAPRSRQQIVNPIDGSGEEAAKSFFLHYDFPPYCTGETGPTMLNRRMIGHGNLAERALIPVMPDMNEFPYAVRVYSECTSSNGSSSMASACGATLALIDAKVPLKALIAGVSVGLVTSPGLSEFNEVRDSSSFALLVDITGSEDHHGDMDFKVAGSSQGVTAVQLDAKLEGGIPVHILLRAFDAAREGRQKILYEMQRSLDKSFACNTSGKSPDIHLWIAQNSREIPRAVLINIDKERRSNIIGMKGEMLRYIEKTFNCSVDMSDDEEDASVYVFGKSERQVAEARLLIQDLGIYVKERDILIGEVAEIKDFGLVVRINRAQRAILHSSKLSHDTELLKTSLNSIVRLGQKLEVQVIEVDKALGLVKVSRKSILHPTESIPDTLRLEIGQSERQISKVDSFPVTPPRRYAPDFFKGNVVKIDKPSKPVAKGVI